MTLKERIVLIARTGCQAIELNALRLEDFESGVFDALTVDDLAPFQYVSLHTPKLSDYGDNDETKRVCDRIHTLNQSLFLHLVVFHPDQIADMGILQHPGFVPAVENMDARKAAFKTPEEFQPIFAKNSGLLMVLDVNHAFTNDPSLALIERFYKSCGDRIAEVHLSGYAGYHEPFYKVQPPQPHIIHAIRDLSVPLIVESVFDSPDELPRERDYVLEILSSR